MFNYDSMIDNPTRLGYIPGDKGMFNAWWMKELIDFESVASRLQKGDRVVVEGKSWIVSGYDDEDDFILVDSIDFPTNVRKLSNNNESVVCTEERCNIYRHGKRLGYQGTEEVGVFD